MRIRKSRAMEDLLSFTRRWCRLESQTETPASSLPAFAPKPLIELVAGVGNCAFTPDDHWRRPGFPRGIFDVENRLLPPNQWQPCNGRMCFAAENQGLWEAFARIERADPLVDVVYDRGTDTEEHVRGGRISHFLTTFCLNELLDGFNGYNRKRGAGFHGAGDLNQVQAKFSGSFVELWSADMFVDPDWHHRFYLLEDKALLLHIVSRDRKKNWWRATARSRSSAVATWLADFAAERQGLPRNRNRR
ncbi:MAG: hypothetical protein KY475_20795 [Planctomycetes bacterium]|nr:hypothetical protein [Planctomycetota bacterium]